MVAQGRCLVSQEIRGLFDEGTIRGRFDESKIQPSSFEPTIGDTGFVLDTQGGLFRPTTEKTVWQSLLELPQGRRQKVDITEGFEVNPGATYLFPLEETVRGSDSFRFLSSSPKSSMGRIFPRTRTIADYNFSFDEITHFPDNIDLLSWLLLQPQNFNLIVGPGLTFNQLRFFAGYDAQLTPGEIVRGWEQSPLLYSKDLEGKLGEPLVPQVAEALKLHLDLQGSGSEGIGALRARKNPLPIDLRNTGVRPRAEDYFEPHKARDGRLTIKPGEHYLMASKEVLSIPEDKCVVLRAFSHQGFRGALHEAGFGDNAFVGDLVLEVTSDETTDIEIVDGMPIGELLVYRTQVPDKLYGAEIGSHYSGQTGPKVAKYFNGFDFATAAKNYAKLDRDVLVMDRVISERLHDTPESFQWVADAEAPEIIQSVEEGHFLSRYDCEDDDLVVQPIPYVVVFDDSGKVFSYVRSENIHDYGDERLFGKHSIGVGGHIGRSDAPNLVSGGLEREVDEELRFGKVYSTPHLVGTILCQDEAVDQYHFGLVYGVKTSGSVGVKDPALASGRMMDLGEIVHDPQRDQKYETWSKALLPHLEDIYQKVKSS